jgi:hypothetical protein
LLDQKKQKIKFSRNASVPQKAFAMQIRQNHGLQNVAPPLASGSLSPTLQQLLLCPCHAQATIVLPDFARSCSADGENEKSIASKTNLKQKKRWPDRKAGRAYGGNPGLAFAMCEARKKRKSRQGALKLFSVLSYSPIVCFQWCS